MNGLDEYCKMTKTASLFGGPSEYINGIRVECYDDGYMEGFDEGRDLGNAEGMDEGIKKGFKKALTGNLIFDGVLILAVGIPIAGQIIYNYQSEAVVGKEFIVTRSAKSKSGIKLNAGDVFTVKEVGSKKKYKKTWIYINRDYSKSYEVSSFFLDKISDYKKYFTV